MQRILERLAFVHLLTAADVAGSSTASKVFDTQEVREPAILVTMGVLTGVGSSNYLTPTLEESDTTTGTDFTAVAAGDQTGTFAKCDSTGKASKTYAAGYKGKKRYIRVNFIFTGTITASILAAVGIVGSARVEPAVAPAAITAA